jgi:hypothetical protein
MLHITLHKAVALELENEDWFAIWSESMGQSSLKNFTTQVKYHKNI